jgi:hypothetical protein
MCGMNHSFNMVETLERVSILIVQLNVESFILGVTEKSHSVAPVP